MVSSTDAPATCKRVAIYGALDETMRKMLKNKKRCCKMCKSHKRGWSCRWKAKEQDAIKRFEVLKKELAIDG